MAEVRGMLPSSLYHKLNSNNNAPRIQNGHAPRDFIRQINNEYQRLNGLALVDEASESDDLA